MTKFQKKIAKNQVKMNVDYIIKQNELYKYNRVMEIMDDYQNEIIKESDITEQQFWAAKSVFNILLHLTKEESLYGNDVVMEVMKYVGMETRTLPEDLIKATNAAFKFTAKKDNAFGVRMKNFGCDVE